MSRFLVKVVETVRCDTEAEAAAFIQEAKDDVVGTLVKYTNDYKEVKSKGEIVDSYRLVQTTKVYNDPKEPIDADTRIGYKGEDE